MITKFNKNIFYQKKINFFSYIKDALTNGLTEPSIIDIKHGEIKNIHYIMELDILLVIADYPYLVDLRSGKFIKLIGLDKHIQTSRIKVKRRFGLNFHN